MDEKPIRVLLVEDNPGDARLLREMFGGAVSPTFELTHVERLNEAVQCLAQERSDVVLLDLLLPDSQGLETFVKMKGQTSQIPIVILTGLEDEGAAVKAVQAGAQDYLVKGDVNSQILVRSMRYAIERQRLLEELRAASQFDELTGLSNRRGFLALGRQQLKIAKRVKKQMLLFFADLDNMKWINDSLGHHEGDLALNEMTQILRETFRDSDILARIGGDEFVILAGEAPGTSAETLAFRLQHNLENHNAKPDRPYLLTASVGVAHYDPEQPGSIEELLARADALMYGQKRSKKNIKPVS
ncbi:MAG: diguanylate cyclase response regulator [Chloroflexi bacterium]|nr:diguanylate cyclase response regulator [Chloroflexota bacterium]